MSLPTVDELHALSLVMLDAGLDSFIVRRVLQRIEVGGLSAVEATG